MGDNTETRAEQPNEGPSQTETPKTELQVGSQDGELHKSEEKPVITVIVGNVKAEAEAMEIAEEEPPLTPGTPLQDEPEERVDTPHPRQKASIRPEHTSDSELDLADQIQLSDSVSEAGSEVTLTLSSDTNSDEESDSEDTE